ncbi:MAG TPA: hypothetical protein VM638_08090 [Actinomycetota bacterium]|nr:hypothetical protein [Actinomycetota bacterium]
MPRRLRTLGVIAIVALGLTATPAAGDHTDPRDPLSPTSPGLPGNGIVQGAGRWEHIRNFPPNPGSDLEFFRKGGDIYASTGTLGQGEAGHVGQRIIRLTHNGAVNPTWVADHGSAACRTANPTGTLGLQHDVQITPKHNPQLVIDATDATGRCHDPAGGGLEFVDISGIGPKSRFQPREIHLTRHAGLSHTVTVDTVRPWIVYNSTSDSSGANRPWIDVLDIRTCLGRTGDTIAQKRARCRPLVYRIPFEPEWSQRVRPNGELEPGSESSCHDITSVGSRIYCAGLNATLIFDTSKMRVAFRPAQ